MKTPNDYVAIYKKQLVKGNMKIAYDGVVNFTTKLKYIFLKNLFGKFSFGEIFKGYTDYTYFYFTNDYVKGKKWRKGKIRVLKTRFFFVK